MNVISANTNVLDKQLFVLNTTTVLAVFRFFFMPVKSLLLKDFKCKTPARFPVLSSTNLTYVKVKDKESLP